MKMIVLMNHNLFPIATIAALLLAGCYYPEIRKSDPEEVRTVITVGLPGSLESRTSLGAAIEGHRNVYWSNGDRIAVNGIASDPLADLDPNTESTEFSIPGSPSYPYNILYPSSFYKNASTVTLPSTQSYTSGGFSTNTEPLVGYVASESGSITLNHLCSIVRISVRKDSGVSASDLATVKFIGNNGEQVCGDFTIDYEAPSLTSAGSDDELTLTVGQALSESTPLDLFIVVPAGTYSGGFTVILEDSMHRTMRKSRGSSITLGAGKLVKLTAFNFVPSALATEFTIEDIEEEVIAPDGYNITGRVVDTSDNPIEGVVVSDGTQCVRTMIDGTFYMESTIANVKYVHVSTPSGYMPAVSGGIPRFYKAKSGITPSAGVYDFGDFVLTPVANPNRFTLLITADPQPRKQSNWNLEKVAYKSLDICQDLYQELYDVSSSISDRQVYGICLGDVVHEDMSLYSNYVSALGTLGYPTYNIIGNHDNDPSAANDDAAAATYESNFGPRNYSFNIGGIHFVMLDNLRMIDNGEGKLTAFEQGLSDEAWTWLQNDMALIPTSTKIMVCAHSPMFKQQSGSERTNHAYHAGTRSDNDGAFGYGDLFDRYTEVHAWAGHTHSGFNFIYGNSHRHKNIQVHTLARSTGELWTNEYLANGTPRGFTIVEVENGNITWKFHPVTRQRGAFQGVITDFCPAGPPAYDWRDWNYNGSGVAVMKVGGGALTEDYQMHVYPRGAYGDNYVYANIFLWDENWDNPVWTPAGGDPVEMTRIYTADNHDIVEVEKVYDKADTEFRSWYKTESSLMASFDDYKTVDTDKITTLFRAPATASPNSGTVSVTDRFGNSYSRTVSW